MGMFDSVYINVKCPYCGNEAETECQTKDLNCTLERWNKGDNVGNDRFNYLDCIAECQSEKCISPHGPSSFFYLIVKVVEGIITGEYEIKK